MKDCTIGVDEAGRGPAIGPLVVASVCIPSDDVRILEGIGAGDSKGMSPVKREMVEELFLHQAEIKGWAFVVKILTAEKIDLGRPYRSLNKMEEDLFVKSILDVTKPETVGLVNMDPLGSNPGMFAERVGASIIKTRPNIVFRSETGMDSVCPVTGMASVLAKVNRDRKMSAISKEMGFDAGSGYPSDPLTRAAVDLMTNDIKPHKYLRWTWSTVSNIWNQKHDSPIPIRTVDGTAFQQRLDDTVGN